MAEPFEILLVEDYEPDAEYLLRLFKKHRVTNQIHVALDGGQALDFLFCRGAYRQRKADTAPLVVLLDIRLPKLDGWEILKQIKENPQTASIPVVMLSGSVFAEESERAQELGAVGCASKPVHMEELERLIAATGHALSRSAAVHR